MEASPTDGRREAQKAQKSEDVPEAKCPEPESERVVCSASQARGRRRKAARTKRTHAHTHTHTHRCPRTHTHAHTPSAAQPSAFHRRPGPASPAKPLHRIAYHRRPSIQSHRLPAIFTGCARSPARYPAVRNFPRTVTLRLLRPPATTPPAPSAVRRPPASKWPPSPSPPVPAKSPVKRPAAPSRRLTPYLLRRRASLAHDEPEASLNPVLRRAQIIMTCPARSPTILRQVQ